MVKIEKFPIIKIGGPFSIAPLGLNIEEEALTYYLTSRRDEVKKYLPRAYPVTIEDAKEIINRHAISIACYASILYCIKMNQGTVGYINITTDRGNLQFHKWTIDFWLMKEFEGNNLMAAAASNMVKILLQNGVDEIYALVHEDNIKSQRVLEKIGFALTDNSNFNWIDDFEGKPQVYKIVNKFKF